MRAASFYSSLVARPFLEGVIVESTLSLRHKRASEWFFGSGQVIKVTPAGYSHSKVEKNTLTTL